jgi:hypothetical protein
MLRQFSFSIDTAKHFIGHAIQIKNFAESKPAALITTKPDHNQPFNQ